MAQYNWTINDHHIVLDAGDSLLHPSAEEIFSFLEEDGDHPNIPNPLEQLTEVHFSKIGSPIKCEIRSEQEDLILDVYAIRMNKKCPIDIVDGMIMDHGITEHEWYYVSGDLEALQKCLSTAGIIRNGKITIGQYINLLRQEFFSAHKEITNNVDTKAISQMLKLEGDVPREIHAQLYDYQKTGFLWMKTMLPASRGCILGDEMGLGKTLQIITLFQEYKNQNKTPLLVVAPVSLLENWKRECAKFAPELSVLVHHGARRTGISEVLSRYDVVVISYNTAVSDLSLLRMIKWEIVVLDEAQNIKNPYSERTKATKAINRKCSIAVTGTPFENHITDIWSLVDFSVPGLLGTISAFENNVTDDILGAQKIEPVLSPIMLRRLVKDVANDLPEKIVIPQPIVMSEMEWFEYDALRQDAKSKADKTSSIAISLLQRLRMYCAHRYLCLDESLDDPYTSSVKYQRFCEIVEEIVKRKEKVIVFTSYKKMFEVFVKDIPKRFGIAINTINGDTDVKDRQKIVDWFNGYDGAVMLALNPIAAGTGLNITGANHVIHYNLEWNPSLEDQSSARAYRRGQKKTVFIYRLYYIGTVEEIVNESIDRKRNIASTAIVGNDGQSDKEDILRAIELAPELYRKDI